MPELPEVETVRRLLEANVLGRTIEGTRLSGLPLRGERVPRALPSQIAGLRFTAARRHGKYLLLDLDGGWTLLSHLGMSGRWLFHPDPPLKKMLHVHARIRFTDGTQLWFQDPRRFGMLRLTRTDALAEDPSLAILGPDPIADPLSGARLLALAAGARVSLKSFLLDQRRLAGIGNIYASEILHRAGLDPRTLAGSVEAGAWDRIARATGTVLREAIAKNGTTFSMYRTLWDEAGGYGERLRVYDRTGQACPVCGEPVRRIVQQARSTYFCPRCQPARRPAAVRARAGRARGARARRGTPAVKSTRPGARSARSAPRKTV
jgi:formamidopyrimidine-DNA glycosylase